MINIIQKLIKEISNEKDIKCTFISNDWVTVLEKDKKVRTITGYKFDLNKASLAKIFDDKYATYELLNLYDIPVIEHKLLYTKTNKNDYANCMNDYEYIKNIYKNYNKDIVIKINKGTCGKNVKHFTNLAEIKKFYNKLSGEKSYSICPFYNIENEYRVVVLNNEIRLIYKKILPIIYGDGKSTIKELLKKYNYNYFKDYNGLNKDVVLKENEEYKHSWKFNLSTGALASLEIDSETKNKIEEIIKKITSKLDIIFCSIDIIKTNKNSYYVLEINSGVMMKNLLIENKKISNKIKLIYSDAIDLMFNK